MEFDGVRLYQVWDPLMEPGKASDEVYRELATYREERRHLVPVEDQKSAAFIFMGVGIWFAAKMEVGESLENFKVVFNNVSDFLHQEDLPDFGTKPMDFDDGVGNELYLGPPAAPFYDTMPDYRKTGIASQPGEIEAIDEFLQSMEAETNIGMLWSYPALQRDQPHVIAEPENGFHVTDSVAETKAQILLNLRCNAKLDRQRSFPYSRTCCTDYGNRPAVQLVIVALGLCYVAVALFAEATALFRPGQQPSTLSNVFNLNTGIFVTALLFCYWADRTQAFAKGSKEYVVADFLLLSGLALIAGLVSVTKSRPPPPRPGAQTATPAPTTLDDMKPLSRDQTDEWKGWMQAAILIYHWTGASRDLDIYIPIRLMVAAYLFQSGFGHAVYFLAKKDFSFKRVASVMLRLNLLCCALPYIMNTDYMFYYFAPLVSFWYVIIYAVFAIGQKYNDNIWALLAKMGVAAVIMPGLVVYTPVMDWAFAALRILCRIEWNLDEWKFRLGLDGFIVYVGMLVGMASLKTKLYNQILTGMYGLPGIVGILSMALYWWNAASLAAEKQQYNTYHPYASFVPILGFIAARNLSRHARTWYSRAFAWLGRCSLETFTLQFHIFLAADTKGLLLLDIFQGDGSLLGDRWRALIFIVPVFLWISSRVADATGDMVKLLTTDLPTEEQNEEFDLEDKADAEPLMEGSGGQISERFKSAMRRVPLKKAWLNDLRLRMAALVAGLWILNWVSLRAALPFTSEDSTNAG
jgi:hypothetical protein